MSDDEGAAAAGVETAVRGPTAAFAQPMAGKKLQKRLYKVVKKAAAAKLLRRGVKEVVKAVRKGEKGLMIIAGDISPLDVISHLPVMCEDASVPYVYVASKAELGAAAATKRPTSVVLISTKGEAAKAFSAADKLKEAIAEVVSITPEY